MIKTRLFYFTTYTNHSHWHQCLFSLVWEETWVPLGNWPVQLGDHNNNLHADAGYHTQVAVVRGMR